ncbi:FadR/GntR family transcriptional regulator [Rubrobacter xylanophilus]|uniref:FadR/GntR family transcriptional regulator n=1 Tax=Rubrobacter xylanophilus TaxID=49319 RepID=UPI001E448538|nr:FadR/GntR family transcriptional regulator [Rubrobacter xylanophilus]
MGKEPQFSPVGTKRTFELVLAQIRDRLESGSLKPGEKLPAEPELAAQLGVSRTALREALKVLELSGYLEIRRGYGGGTFVAKPTVEEFKVITPSTIPIAEVTPRQLSEVRFAIEPQAAKIAAQAETRDVRQLEDTVSEMHIFDDRPARVLEANVDFHVAVAKISANPIFVTLLEELRPAVYRELNHLVRNSEWRESCLRGHEQIIEAIAVGDCEEAEKMMRLHLKSEISAEESGRGK